MADPIFDIAEPAPLDVLELNAGIAADPDFETKQSPTEQDLIDAIRAAEKTAYGSDGDSELSADRARAIDDYLGKPYGNEVEGRSQVVSRDVHDTIEWIKPSLLRIFTSGDEVARFDPVGAEDEPAAAQETDYINHVIQEKNPWFNIAYEWFTDALLTKNAYALGYWDTSIQVESEKYQGHTDEQLMMVLRDPNIELIEHTARPAHGAQPQIDPASGQPLPPPMLHDYVLRRTREYRGVKICVLPPERCLVSEDVSGPSVRQAPFFQYWEQVTISKLRSMGFDIPDDIADEGGSVDTDEDRSRDNYNEQMHRAGADGSDPSMRKVTFRVTWIQFDFNGDGLAEHRMVMSVGETVLFNEESNGVQVAAIVPTPLPHRHPGLSVHDMVEDLQEIKTAIWRQTLDNLYLANNGRHAISDRVNLEDMLTSRPGGVIRISAGGIPSNEIFPLNHQFVAGQALSVMDYVDRVREARTGTGQSFTGVDPNALQKSHSGVAIAQLTSAAAQRVEMIARVFAEGVKELFLIVHELCSKHGHKPEVVRLRNQWVEVDPSQWKRRSDMKLSVGLGTGNKEQLMQNLMLVAGAQEKLAPLGLIRPKHAYHTFAELVKVCGLPSATKFADEPEENAQPPQRKSPEEIFAQTEIEKEKMKQGAENERTKLEIASKERIEAAKIAAGLVEKGVDVGSARLVIAELLQPQLVPVPVPVPAGAPN